MAKSDVKKMNQDRLSKGVKPGGIYGNGAGTVQSARRMGMPTYDPASSLDGSTPASQPARNVKPAVAPKPTPKAASVGRYYASADGKKTAAAMKSAGAATPKPTGASSFDKAFASARRAGKNEFTWNGKRYNTKVK